MTLALATENGFDLVRAEGPGPVDGEREAIITLGKEASVPCRKSQDAGATEAPVGDKDGSFHGFFEGRNGGHGNGDALQIGEARVVDVKGEEGGDGGSEFMLGVANGLAGFRTT